MRLTYKNTRETRNIKAMWLGPLPYCMKCRDALGQAARVELACENERNRTERIESHRSFPLADADDGVLDAHGIITQVFCCFVVLLFCC